MIEKISLAVTSHAKARWAERFTGDLNEAYSKSLPFGAQYGKSKYMLNEELSAVFVVNDGVIITVLTKMQAIANMQSRGIRFETVKSYDPPETKKAEAKEFRRRGTQSQADLFISNLFDSLRTFTDEQLSELALGNRHRSLIEYVLRLRKMDRNRIAENERSSLLIKHLLSIIETELGLERRTQVIESWRGTNERSNP